MTKNNNKLTIIIKKLLTRKKLKVKIVKVQTFK